MNPEANSPETLKGRVLRPTLFWSGVLGETILIVPDGYDLARLPEDYLGLVPYTVREIVGLTRRRVSPEVLRGLHLIKSQVGGTVVTDDPEAAGVRQEEPPEEDTPLRGFPSRKETRYTQ